MASMVWDYTVLTMLNIPNMTAFSLPLNTNPTVLYKNTVKLCILHGRCANIEIFLLFTKNYCSSKAITTSPKRPFTMSSS